MADNRIALSIDLPASLDTAWNSILDWQGQSRWMLLTRVWITKHSPTIVGTHIAAFTGIAPALWKREKAFGVLDLMEVTLSEKSERTARCNVLHYGKVIRGIGSFELTSIDDLKTRFDWSETIEAPRALFILMKPFIALGVFISLSRFAKGLRTL